MARLGYSLRKRGDGSYEMCYYATNPATGRSDRHFETIHADSDPAAHAQAAQIVARAKAVPEVAAGKLTVAAYLEQWLSEIKVSVRPKTLTWYECMVRNHIIPHIGGIALAKLQPSHIQTFYADLLDQEGDDGETLERVSVHGVHRALRAALNRAVRRRLLTYNPLSGVDPIRVEEAERVILTVDEAFKLLDVAEEIGKYSLYLAALTTGMRQGELLGLRWQDINFNQRTIQVRQQLAYAYSEDGPIFAPPKTKRSTGRLILICEPLYEALQEYWEREQADRLRPERTRDYDLVWHIADGGPIGSRNLHRQFKALLQRAGCPNVRFHDLRHTSASLLLALGVDLSTVKEILGHASITTTTGYTHLNIESQRIAAERVGKLFAARKNRERVKDADRDAAGSRC